VPTAIGVFATTVAIVLGALDQPIRSDILTYFVAMLLMILVGVVGFILHIGEDLTVSGDIVLERFLRGAPPLAPMLFADIGLLGLIAMLDPVEQQEVERSD